VVGDGGREPTPIKREDPLSTSDRLIAQPQERFESREHLGVVIRASDRALREFGGHTEALLLEAELRGGGSISHAAIAPPEKYPDPVDH
jgi:hypothetical protein